MKLGRPAIFLFAVAAVGCGAVGHIVTAPARLVHSEKPKPERSDVEHPGRPVLATPTPKPKVAQKKGKVSPKTTKTAPSPSASPRIASKPQPQFPVAKAVPGKPGVVYNPFDPKGSLIDVSGYASGSKVKDPDSQKIFIVP